MGHASQFGKLKGNKEQKKKEKEQVEKLTTVINAIFKILSENNLRVSEVIDVVGNILSNVNRLDIMRIEAVASKYQQEHKDDKERKEDNQGKQAQE